MMKIYAVFLIFLLTTTVTAQEDQDRLFDTRTIHSIKINFYKSDDWDSVLARFNVGNDTLTHTPVKIKIDSTIFDSVGLSIKGHPSINPDGSYQKYPFKVDFNEFKKGQKYDSVKKFNLNVNAFDNNILMNNIFAYFGLPYQRVSKTQVTLDTANLGDYIIVEQVDKSFLNRTFGNKSGNLYKGDLQANLKYLGDEQAFYENKYTLKTNEDKNDYSDLIHFIDILNNVKNEQALEDSIRNNFDIDNYIKIFSLQIVMGKIDDYFDKNHNYYLYHNDETKRFSFIPYDNDMIAQRNPLFIGNVGNLPLLKSIYTIPALKNQYFNCMCNVFSKIGSSFPAIETKYDSDYTLYKNKTSENIIYLESQMKSSGFTCPTVGTSKKVVNNQSVSSEQQILYPFENKLRITTSLITGKEFSLAIYSVNGRIRYNQTFQNTQPDILHIDLSLLPPGSYVAEMKCTSGNRVQKFAIPSFCKQ